MCATYIEPYDGHDLKFKSIVYIRLHTKISVQHIGTSTTDDTIDSSTWYQYSHTSKLEHAYSYMSISIMSSKLLTKTAVFHQLSGTWADMD